MRKIALFAILLAFSAISWAQNDSRFSTDGASVMWQNVYQTQLDSASVVDGLLASGHFDGVILSKDGFTCRVVPHEVDYRGAGMKRGLTSMYLLGGELEARAVVQIREGRYRVTVDEMVFTTTLEDEAGAICAERERDIPEQLLEQRLLPGARLRPLFLV